MIGMPTLLEIKSVEESAQLCAELGLQFVELNMNLPDYQVDRLAEIADNMGIYFTIHLDELFNPCDFNERVATAYTETILTTIDAAKKLGVPILNMHMPEGVYFTLPDQRVYLYDEYFDVFREKLTTFRNTCEAAIGSAPIKICVENTGGYDRAAFMRAGVDILLESPVFGLTFDIGHNASIGFTDEIFIQKYLDKLCHMHLHDAIGKSHHLALGDGTLDLHSYIDLARACDCGVVLETKTVEALRRSVRWLNENNIMHI